MSLTLNGQGTSPQPEIKTYGVVFDWMRFTTKSFPVKMCPEDFCAFVHYFLTNTDLRPNDPRRNLVHHLKKHSRYVTQKRGMKNRSFLSFNRTAFIEALGKVDATFKTYNYDVDDKQNVFFWGAGQQNDELSYEKVCALIIRILTRAYMDENSQMRKFVNEIRKQLKMVNGWNETGKRYSFC